MAANGDVMGSVDDFLKRCVQSGDAAYAAVRSVLESLENPQTRVPARIFLSELQKRFPTTEDADHCFKKFHFRIQDIMLDQNGIYIIYLSLSLSGCELV